MLLFWIILLMEAKTWYGLPPGVSIMTGPGDTAIQSSVVAGREGIDPPEVPVNTGTLLQDLTLTNSLTVLGNTLSGKTSVAGGLTVDGTLSLNAQGIQTLGDTLYLERNRLAAVDIMNGALRVGTDGWLTVAGNVNVRGTLGASTITPIAGDLTVDLAHTGSGAGSFGTLLVKGMGSALAAIDASGSARFSANVEASGTGKFGRVSTPLLETSKLIFTADEQSNSVGTGRLPAGLTTMKIATNAVSANSRIFVTPLSVSTQPLSVTELTPKTGTQGGSFTVAIANPAPHDLDFNWFIIN